ncbi:MAG: ribosome biogenesis GTP-binding protein YihA/YsxC [Firmicutes bacterium]|nr:ribosome biogenesis GTP-binding protein YihA/YsxC [Bacillota bacterium]
MSVIINNTDIATTGVRPEHFPDTGWPEVAFVGKSNVGKSSLINAMLGRKKLARTSQTPGKTRTINFFHVESKLYFVDLPGYGYARVSKSESEKWGEMVEGYLKDRPQLKRIFLLVDIRHEPGVNDKMLYEWFLHYGLPFTVVATKSDKLKRSQVQKHLAIIRRGLGAPQPPIPFSSETKDGRDQLWSLIVDSCGVSML